MFPAVSTTHTLRQHARRDCRLACCSIPCEAFSPPEAASAIGVAVRHLARTDGSSAGDGHTSSDRWRFARVLNDSRPSHPTPTHTCPLPLPSLAHGVLSGLGRLSRRCVWSRHSTYGATKRTKLPGDEFVAFYAWYSLSDLSVCRACLKTASPARSSAAAVGRGEKSTSPHASTRAALRGLSLGVEHQRSTRMTLYQTPEPLASSSELERWRLVLPVDCKEGVRKPRRCAGAAS
jgi:hypothetical protein